MGKQFLWLAGNCLLTAFEMYVNEWPYTCMCIFRLMQRARLSDRNLFIDENKCQNCSQN